MFRDSGNALVRAGFIVHWEATKIGDLNSDKGYFILTAKLAGRKGDTFHVATNEDESQTISFNGEPLT